MGILKINNEELVLSVNSFKESMVSAMGPVAMDSADNAFQKVYQVELNKSELSSVFIKNLTNYFSAATIESVELYDDEENLLLVTNDEVVKIVDASIDYLNDEGPLGTLQFIVN